MIKITKEERISEITEYEKSETTPNCDTSFCSTPEMLIINSKDKSECYRYLKKIRNIAVYVRQLLIILKTSKIAQRERDKKDSMDWDINHELYGTEQAIRKFNKNDIFFKKDAPEKVNIKECIALNTIECERKIFQKCELLKELEYGDSNLLELIDSKMNQLDKLHNQYKSPADMNNYRFDLDLINEIYIYFDTTIDNIIENLFKKYFTPSSYFLNSGHSFFAIDLDKYLYLCGDSKGTIAECKLYKTFRNGFDENIFEELEKDFSKLILNLDLILNSETIAIDKTLCKKFYETYYNVPKNFLDIISTYEFEGRRLVDKNLHFFDKKDFPLIMTYLSKSIIDEKKGKPSIVLQLFHLEKKNASNYGNRKYDKRLDLFKDFIKKYALYE